MTSTNSNFYPSGQVIQLILTTNQSEIGGQHLGFQCNFKQQNSIGLLNCMMKIAIFEVQTLSYFFQTCNNDFLLNLPEKTLVIRYIIMQQKNNSPQNHQQAETQGTISALKCLNTKFINVLNRHSLPSSGNLQKTNSCSIEKRPKNQQIFESKHNISILSLLDEEDLLFLEDFQKEDSKSSTFTLTANLQPIDYTESVVINNQNTITYYQDESIIEASHPSIWAPPLKNITNTPATLLKKESEIKFGNGGVFKGEMKNGKMINGTFVLDSMFTYEGEILNDKFHGKGTLTFHNGHTVTCNWDQGKPTGHVDIQYPRGQRYEGELVDFRKHGIGCLYFNDGSRYVGEFRRGEMTGQGCYYSTSREQKRGYWINGEFQGQIIPKSNSHSQKKSPKSKGLRELPDPQRQSIRIE